MPVQDNLRTDDLQETLALVQDQVRKDPATSKHRVCLFQLLAVMGQWERALNQLNLLGEMDASTLPMVQTYREALQCEALRREVFGGLRAPLVLGEPQRWLALLIEALRLLATKDPEQARCLRDEALDGAPPSRGVINDQPFEWIMDADLRLGPVVEAIVNGRYYWAPFQNIRRITVEPPSDLRDLVWMPAEFIWANGGSMVGLIPTRYPGSDTAPDSTIQLARRTDWVAAGEGLETGLGQRMFATEQDDYPLMDLRSIEIEVSSAGAGAESRHG